MHVDNFKSVFDTILIREPLTRKSSKCNVWRKSSVINTLRVTLYVYTFSLVLTPEIYSVLTTSLNNTIVLELKNETLKGIEKDTI